MLRRWLPLVAVSVALLHAVPACMSDSSDTRLNPQPLPPGDPPDGFGETTGGNDNSSSSSGGASPGGADAGTSADAGAEAEAEAADAADGGGDQ